MITNAPTLGGRSSKTDGNDECEGKNGRCVKEWKCEEKNVLKKVECSGKNRVCCRKGECQTLIGFG